MFLIVVGLISTVIIYVIIYAYIFDCDYFGCDHVDILVVISNIVTIVQRGPFVDSPIKIRGDISPTKRESRFVKSFLQISKWGFVISYCVGICFNIVQVIFEVPNVPLGRSVLRPPLSCSQILPAGHCCMTLSSRTCQLGDSRDKLYLNTLAVSIQSSRQHSALALNEVVLDLSQWLLTTNVLERCSGP